MLVLRLVLIVGTCACGALGDRYHPESADAPVRSGSARRKEELTARFWVQEAQDGIARRVKHSAGRGRARNVVLFMGDGMSVPTMTAARTLLGQRRGDPGEEAELAFENFPTLGLSKTYCVNQQVADSACTATAFLCGAKNNDGVLGLTAAVTRRDCQASLDPDTHLDSIAAWALADGRDVGVVTTTRITHASPAAMFSRTAHRDWESNAEVERDGQDPSLCPDIAHQLVHSYPGNQFKVILGGGRRSFLPNDTRDEEGDFGTRTDGLNLIQDWQEQKGNRNSSYAYVWNRDQLMSHLESPPEYLMGLFESSHMAYHLEANATKEPTLKEMTEVAIRSLSRNDSGFFLFVEGGRIDHAHHGNQVHLALDETIEMSEAVARAVELLSDEDTLIVVTADHTHVMSFNGYSPRGHDVLGGSNMMDRDGVPFMTLSYTNGPGARQQVDGVRPNVLLDENFGHTQWASHADVPLRSETHGADDVAVFARGPHHDMFSGLYEQSRLPHLMAYAGCFGPGRHACDDDNAAAAPPLPAALLLAAILLQMMRLL